VIATGIEFVVFSIYVVGGFCWILWSHRKLKQAQEKDLSSFRFIMVALLVAGLIITMGWYWNNLQMIQNQSNAEAVKQYGTVVTLLLEWYSIPLATMLGFLFARAESPEQNTKALRAANYLDLLAMCIALIYAAIPVFGIAHVTFHSILEASSTSAEQLPLVSKMFPFIPGIDSNMLSLESFQAILTTCKATLTTSSSIVFAYYFGSKSSSG
jgi:hypothetical protein